MLRDNPDQDGPSAEMLAEKGVEKNRTAEYTPDTMPEKMSDRTSEYICICLL
jgi:hypothetical protein